MKCPSCNSRLKCTDTRYVKTDSATRRRYHCTCGARLTTKEYVIHLNEGALVSGYKNPHVYLVEKAKP
jgi:transcriptional regulator NrdR family protein